MIRIFSFGAVWALCAWGCRPAFSQDTASRKTYTLRQCVDLALLRNPDVTAARFSMETGKVYRDQAKAALLPSISGNVSRAVYNGKSVNPYTNEYVNQQYTADNYGLNASLVLWHGSSIMNYLKQSNLDYQASRMSYQQAKDQVTIQVILSYLAVLNQAEQLRMARGQAEVTRRQVARLEVLNQSGAIAPSDLYDMRGQLSANELTVLATGNALESATLDLAQLMNIPYAGDMQLVPVHTAILSPYQGTVDSIYQYTLGHLAQVKAVELHGKSAQRAVKAARGSLLPTLYLSGGLYTNYSSAANTEQFVGSSDEKTDHYVEINQEKLPVYAPTSRYHEIKVPYGDQWKNNFNSGISLNLSVPILNGLAARTRVRAAKIAESQTTFETQTVKIQLRQAIERDYFQMRMAYATYTKLVHQEADYEESFREAQVKFEAGVLNAVEFVLVQNNLDQAKLNLIAAKYHYILETKILDYYQGRLNW